MTALSIDMGGLIPPPSHSDRTLRLQGHLRGHDYLVLLIGHSERYDGLGYTAMTTEETWGEGQGRDLEHLAIYSNWNE